MAESVSLLIEAEDKASKIIEGVGDALSGMAKIATGIVVAGAAAAAAGIAALGAAGTKAVMAFAESEQVVTRMEAQLEALGSSAKVSSKEIQDLATELSRMSGFDDEDLIEAQGTLLRFGDLSKEQFNKASRAATDLAAITGMDVKSAFQQLGIALDNPELGFGRLKRQIGDLTDAEKEQIKTAMEAGDTLKAQTIILDALSRKTAGAAMKMGNTFIGQMNKLKTRWGNFWEDLGAEIVPFLGDWLDAFNDFFDDLTGPILKFVKSETFSKWMNNIYDYVFHKLIPSIREFSQRVMGTFNLAIRIAGRFISEFILPSLRRLWLWLQKQIPPAIKMVADFFNQKFLPAVRTVLEWIETKGLKYLGALYDWLKQKIPQAIDTVRLWWYNTLKPAFDKLALWVKETAVPALTKVYNWLITSIPRAIEVVSGWFTNTLKPAVERVWQTIKEEFIPALIETYNWLKEKITGATGEWLDKLGLLKEMLIGIKDVAGLFGDESGLSKISLDIKAIGDAIDYLWERVKGNWAFIMAQFTMITTMVRDAMNIVKAIFSGDFDQIILALWTFGDNFRVNLWNLLRSIVGIFMDTSWWPDAKPISKSIIEGLIAGWRDNWDSFWSTVNNDLTALMNKIKELVGFGSPAEKYKTIGKSMAQGIQVGFSTQLEGKTSAISSTLTPGNFGGGRGGAVINITYAPAMSTASPQEFEAAFVPLVDSALRRVNRRR